MAVVNITHINASKILPYIENVNSYDQLNDAVAAISGDDDNDVKGCVFEVFFEFWARNFGTDMVVGIHNLKDTSHDKYQRGYDFAFKGNDNQLGLVQCKWRNPNNHKKHLNEATNSFNTEIDNNNTSKENSILFVNFFVEKDNENVFDYTCRPGRNRKIRVIGKQMQERFILLTPSFWDDFRSSVAIAVNAPKSVKTIEQPYEHQQRAIDACERVINGDLTRGKVHCATGGGKSLIELISARKFLQDPSNKSLIIVAPTIDLVNQHISYFSDRGALDFPNLSIHAFKTGAVVQYRTTQEQNQIFTYGTDEDVLNDHIKNTNTRRLVVFTTYSSIKNCLNQFTKNDKQVGCIIFDEYHNLIQQETKQGIEKEFTVKWIKGLPAEKILFFSASVKRGRIVSAMNETLFGPELINISYKELREKGLLVPRINIIPIRLSNPKWSKTVDALMSENLWTGVDAVECYKQAAGTVVAYNIGCELAGDDINLITFQDRVAHCIEIQENADSEDGIVRKVLSNGSSVNIQTVHSNVHSIYRKDIYGTISQTTGNILLQHSCATEGIDIPNLRAIMIGRKLSIIETQQAIGRIVRTDPVDRENITKGSINVNNGEGWKKYRSYVFLLCDAKNDDDYKDQLADFVLKLQLTGLNEDDYQFAELTPERVAKPEDRSDGELVPQLNFDFEQGAFEQIVRSARAQIEDQENQFMQEEIVEEIRAFNEQVIKNGFVFS